MDTQTQEMFDTIIAQDKDTLNVQQQEFLMARREYMNDAQRERYADMIKAHEAGIKKGAKKEDSNEKKDEDEKPLSKMNVEELKAKAEELEIDGFEDMKKDELVEAIKEATA